MCKQCRTNMREVIQNLLNGEGEIMEHIEECVAAEMTRISTTAEEHGIELPDDAEEQIRDAIVASQIAVAAAGMASRTDAFTREGQVTPGMVMGMWMAEMLEYEIQQQVKHQDSITRHLLGLGDN